MSDFRKGLYSGILLKEKEMKNELFTERVLRERWDIARGIYGRALDGVVRPTVSGKLDYIEVRIE